MNQFRSQKLSKFYQFFEIYGAERLNGLDESYFVDLNGSEREEAWDFLTKGDDLSEESINALYLLDKSRAISFFKEKLTQRPKQSPYPAQRQAFELNRLLMLSLVNNVEPDETYVTAMTAFSDSEYSRVRTAFANCVPVHEITPKVVEALKKMIFTETERAPLTAAITKFMAIHGMDYKIDDPNYRRTYNSLRSENSEEKSMAIKRLTATRPNC